MTKRKRGETKLGKFSKKLRINLGGNNVTTAQNNDNKGELCPTCGKTVYPTKCNDPLYCDYKKLQDNLVWSKFM